jgi:hypothetical protein
MSEIIPAAGSNNPPFEALGPALFTLKRADGSIELRSRSPNHLWVEQLKLPEYRFDDHIQITETVWSVKGKKI